MLKANVLLGKPTSTDISTEEMLHEWEGLNTLPGVAYTVKRYETFPTPEEFNALIDADADAALGVWMSSVSPHSLRHMAVAPLAPGSM